jgi:hypothetical protein
VCIQPRRGGPGQLNFHFKPLAPLPRNPHLSFAQKFHCASAGRSILRPERSKFRLEFHKGKMVYSTVVSRASFWDSRRDKRKERKRKKRLFCVCCHYEAALYCTYHSTLSTLFLDIFLSRRGCRGEYTRDGMALRRRRGSLQYDA